MAEKKSYSVMDYINAKFRMQQKKLPTKSRFGELMHGDEIDDDEKRRIAEEVLLGGGYDALEDDR